MGGRGRRGGGVGHGLGQFLQSSAPEDPRLQGWYFKHIVYAPETVVAIVVFTFQFNSHDVLTEILTVYADLIHDGLGQLLQSARARRPSLTRLCLVHT